MYVCICIYIYIHSLTCARKGRQRLGLDRVSTRWSQCTDKAVSAHSLDTLVWRVEGRLSGVVPCLLHREDRGSFDGWLLGLAPLWLSARPNRRGAAKANSWWTLPPSAAAAFQPRHEAARRNYIQGAARGKEEAGVLGVRPWVPAAQGMEGGQGPSPACLSSRWLEPKHTHNLTTKSSETTSLVVRGGVDKLATL